MTVLKLKKTKVPMRASEYIIYNLINQFECRCSSVYCSECNIIKHKGLEDGTSREVNQCMARYIYENIIDTEQR